MRGLRFFLIVGLACVYFVCLRFVFHEQTAQASAIESIPVRGDIDKVFGNGSLSCLLLYKTGEIDMVNAGRAIDTRQIAPSKGAGRFTMAALTPTGIGYLLDDQNSICRVTMSGDRATSKPIEADGQILAMAVQEKRGLLWLAVKRDHPHPDDLFVLTIGLRKGKVLNSTNLDKQGTPTVFETTSNGDYVMLATDGSPSLYVFDYQDKAPFSKAVTLPDLVTSVAYQGDFPVLGLRSGAAVMLDPETWRTAGSINSGQYSATAVGVGDGALGLGHGAANPRAETGSFQSIDLKTWETTSQCVARSEVVGVASVNRRFVYGLDTGSLAELTAEGSCASLDIPSQNRPGPVRYMSAAGNVCLVVGDKAILRLSFN